MSAIAGHPVPRRRRFQGVGQIVAFNWPRYAVAVPAVALLLSAAALPGVPLPIAGAARVGAALVGWWVMASLAASYWVYDRAGLYGLGWLASLIGTPRRWASIHAGLDEFSGALEGRFGVPPVAVLDIYDRALMPERSIARARRGAGPCTAADHRRLPLAGASCDAVFLILAAHELRSHAGRVELFGEARRILAPGGRILVVEHLRDAWNFAAFGPGFLHFHSRRSWLAAFAGAGLRVESEASITPFVRIFTLWRDAR